MSLQVHSRVVVLLALLCYTALSGARLVSDRPQVDEAWHASPALNLAQHGSMYTSILESKGTFYEGLDRYTFWIMPGYPVALAGWFTVAGSGLFRMRMLSALFGGVIILAVFGLVSRLMADRATGALASVLVAADFAVVRSGAIGRMDSMCAAFGFGGLAIYVLFRQRNTRAAFVAGHALTALSVFTHPNGMLYVAGLAILATAWDGRRLRFTDLALAAIPYLVLLAAWGSYIANDFGLFRQQYSGNAARRFSGVWTPLTALRREIMLRYLGGGHTLLRAALVLPYLLGVVAALLTPALRRHKGVQTLLALTFLFLVHQWLFEAVKLPFYLVHTTPLCMALVAVVVRWWWCERPRWRGLAATGTILLVAVQLAGTAYSVRRASYRRVFVPVVQAVRANARPTDLVMGSAELAFGLGFDANLVDDLRLGYISGKRPDVVVLDRRYKESFEVGLAVNEKPAFEHVRALLERYQRVFAVEDYEVFVRPRSGDRRLAWRSAAYNRARRVAQDD